MLSLNYENVNYVMTQILMLSCVTFSYVSIRYVLAEFMYQWKGLLVFKLKAEQFAKLQFLNGKMDQMALFV